jgi:hypothetical protein
MLIGRDVSDAEPATCSRQGAAREFPGRRPGPLETYVEAQANRDGVLEAMNPPVSCRYAAKVAAS